LLLYQGIFQFPDSLLQSIVGSFGGHGMISCVFSNIEHSWFRAAALPRHSRLFHLEFRFFQYIR
jgi:hypothetical protein